MVFYFCFLRCIVFVEKMLRVQPNVKKLYLLVRAPDAKSASQRFHDEAIAKDLFRVLREKMGSASFQTLISEKVTLVPGDITCEKYLGLKDSNLAEEMMREVGIVVNLAATTNFHERYDVAFNLNTMGAKNVLDFSKMCAKLKMLLHVSTAYVSGERAGLILEKPYCMGETLNGLNLDLDMEKIIMEERLIELQAKEATEQEITLAMKDLGIQRTLDSFVVSYGKGRLTCLLGDPQSILDMSPLGPSKLQEDDELSSRYDDTNTEKLRMTAREGGIETDVFYFDPKIIDWEDYFTNIHFPGLIKYVFK
ncbi:hypothetical protein RHMOL_Rhmol11G0172900 [Rhododendron molle]|uniref:Uncharacterized protein n=1 Tax=Rhododendron molle TaxID=49168 RepID=A0ACC0LT69_RHOML|nr:hypothetical protein RHMOL_Rhmol11G0172900 [Rhododendron molle]